MKFEKPEASGESGKFLKIPSGDAVKGVCRGEVYKYYMKWIDKKTHIVSKDTPGARARYRINFVVKEDNKFVAKILEFGPQVSGLLHDLSEEYDLSETVIKIGKSGSGLETTYSVLPLKDTPPLNEIRKVPLQILDVQNKPKESDMDQEFGQPPHDMDEDPDALPF